MPRPLRIESEGAFYHITGRGNEKRPIFIVERDFTRFLDRLERIYERYGILIHAYVLMTNHLLLETPRGNLSAALHDLNTAYINYRLPLKRLYERRISENHFQKGVTTHLTPSAQSILTFTP